MALPERLTLASQNPGKQREIAAWLGPHGIELSLAPAGWSVEEDGHSFAANARKKAETLAARLGVCCLADDSGLEVAALGGAPGIYSARYSAAGTDVANCVRLLGALNHTPMPQRQAELVCVLALAAPAAPTQIYSGRLAGHIAPAAAGTAGFGYDPLFVPEGQSATLAELGADFKHRCSHRARALSALLAALLPAQAQTAPAK